MFACLSVFVCYAVCSLLGVEEDQEVEDEMEEEFKSVVVEEELEAEVKEVVEKPWMWRNSSS